MTLQEKLDMFREPVYVRVQRSNETYSATANYVQQNLSRLVDLYKQHTNDQQTMRLIRDDMDNLLRRYHKYCIEQNIGAHYIQQGEHEKTVFEHMVPNSTVRDLLLHSVITPEQACNMPTCRLSKESDDQLRLAGWNSRTPDIYNFWKRYTMCFDVADSFHTYDGVVVTPDSWNLDKHFEYFIK